MKNNRYRKGKAMAGKDRAFDIFLMILIGVPAVVMLSSAGIRHLALNELIITIAVGLAGIIWVLIKALSLRSFSAERADTGTSADNITNQNS